MGKMAAGHETKPHEGVTGHHQRHECGGVCRGAGMRLYVCELTSKKLGNPFYRKTFHDIDKLAPAVIAPSRQALGIFVGKNRTLSFQYCRADEVFRRDQLDLVL